MRLSPLKTPEKPDIAADSMIAVVQSLSVDHLSLFSLKQPVKTFFTEMLNFFKNFDMHRDDTDATPMQQRRKTEMRPRYHHSEPTLNISRDPQVNETFVYRSSGT